MERGRSTKPWRRTIEYAARRCSVSGTGCLTYGYSLLQLELARSAVPALNGEAKLTYRLPNHFDLVDDLAHAFHVDDGFLGELLEIVAWHLAAK